MPKLQLGDEYYRIVGDDGTEGELVAYGDAAVLETGGTRFLAVVDEDPDDQQNVISLLTEDEWIVEGKTVPNVQMEDVEFKVQGGGDGGGEGEPEAEVDVAPADDDDGDDDDDDDLDFDDEDEDQGVLPEEEDDDDDDDPLI